MWFAVAGSECVDRSAAEEMFERAIQLEEEGNFERAYNIFKNIEGLSCENSDVRAAASNKAVEIRKVLSKG